jgi:hypothetical protein
MVVPLLGPRDTSGDLSPCAKRRDDCIDRSS